MVQEKGFSHISNFLNEVKNKLDTDLAREQTYRSVIEKLLCQSDEDISTVNDGKRIECGAPDIAVRKNKCVLGYLECKDIHVDLRNLPSADLERLNNYRNALPNLLLTNCLDWQYFRDGKIVRSVSIARYNGEIEVFSEHFSKFFSILENFLNHKPKIISEADELAIKMAKKTKLIKEVFYKSLKLSKTDSSELVGLYKYFKTNLISDISIEDFAEISAETITYGMFVARLKDEQQEPFYRKNAMFLIPRSHPFLSSFFQFVAGPKLEDHLAWIIDDLAEILKICDMEQISNKFGKLTGFDDPFIHFYETFLKAYDPNERRERGVWYTPVPVVKFIVNAVDQVLKSEFDLTRGLATEKKVTREFETGQRKQFKNNGKFTKDGKQLMVSKKVHCVQVIDPCTGTGTFLAEVLNKIAEVVKEDSPSHWSDYVEEHLIPRIHGFELLMAPYTMCHIKLEKVLDDLKYKPKQPDRFSVYLTNSLEEGAQVDQTLPFDHNWLVREAKDANTIKRDMPIMCVIGNPPYLSRGGPATGWIGRLLEESYKMEPGGKVKLKDNAQQLNDYYVRFIRLASHFIEKNGEGKDNGMGVMAFVTNHSYLDSTTFRGMRWHLLKTFDKIWILDLHGNVRRRTVSDTTEKDEGIFDIEPGVAIIIAVKNNKNKNELADLMHGDLYGSRESKFNRMKTNNFKKLFKKIETRKPYYPFVKWNYDNYEEYQKGISLNELMPENAMGVKTNRDEFTIDVDPDALWNRMQRFVQLDPEVARKEYNLRKDTQTWNVASAQRDVRNNFDKSNIVPITYRPFDNRWTYYTGTSVGIHGSPSKKIMENFLTGEKNIGLVFTRQVRDESGPPIYAFVTESIYDNAGLYNFIGGTQVAPLYIFPSNGDLIEDRRTNFRSDVKEKICETLKNHKRGIPDDWEIFDYVYGTLHNKSYQEKYDSFLRMDFPRIPWPKNAQDFWSKSDMGKELRLLHLSISETRESSKFKLLGEGENMIENCKFHSNKIWINKTQFFSNVSEEVWNFYIGGNQPARKWLRNQKGNKLTYADFRHYQCILEIIEKTISIVKSV